MGKWLGITGGVLSAAGTIIALLLLRDDDWKRVGEAIFPWPVVLFLVALLLATWGYLAYRHFRLTPGRSTGWVGVSDDQARLDRIFQQLPRVMVRNIQDEDFSGPWREELTWPINSFVHEFDGAENEFDSRQLERRRHELFETAQRLMIEEAGKSWVHSTADGYRNVGWSDVEISEDPEKLDTARARSDAIRAAALEFTKAHDALVRAAKQEGFALNLDGEPARPSWS